MRSCFSERSERGHLHVTKSGTSGRVNTLGQVAVHFHHGTSGLEHWFKIAQRETANRATAAAKSRTNPQQHQARLPSPRLHIAIQICGSRGDIQPFIPIAKLLQEPPYGHRVRICTHPAFKEFVESNGLEFFSIGGDPEALMAYMVKNPGLVPGIASIKAGDLAKRRKEMAEMFQGTWRSCIEAGDGLDVVIANPPSMGHIHCVEKLGIPLHIVFTMPWSPTKAFHHPLAAMNYDREDKSLANYFSFAIMELMTWQGLGDLINKFRTQTLKLDPISPLWGFQLLQRLQVPHSYLWSQSLIPKPDDWPAHLSVTGFSFLKLGSTYTPPQELATFLEKGPPPVYIGFGSIVVDDPLRLTKLIFEAVRLAGVRAVVSKGWGGIGTEDVPENIYLIGNCPHDWLFQRVSCVVHHGGAGTTAMGIALGKPTVIVPFFGDQPFWGRMIHKAGAGPKPIPYKQLTAESLAASIQFALEDDVCKVVEEMATRIAAEDGATETVRNFEDSLRVDEMRCHICPERLAIWQETNSGIHLSGLAASVLCEKELIHPKQLRLIRHRHWYMHQGAETPGIGAAAAVSGFFTSMVTNTSDYRERLRKRPTGQHPPILSKVNVESESVDGKSGEKVVNPAQLERLAWRMARRTYEGRLQDDLTKEPVLHGPARLLAHKSGKKAAHRRAHQITSATVHYAGDLTETGMKASVAIFYNVANGFRNMPAYFITNEVHRRRDEIVGLRSGLGVAGKEFVQGLYDGFAGLVKHPYLGAKNGGPLGFPKGIGRGIWGFGCHTLAAIFGVPGYSLKGVERALSKQRLTTLQAELYLIRLRQATHDFQTATEEERDQVAQSWLTIRANVD